MIPVVVALVSLVSLSQVGTIRDRPLTWDYMGLVPLESAEKPSQGQRKSFDLMRSGEYYRVYVATKAHFESHPDDLVDAWILHQCARWRRSADELLVDCTRWQEAHSTTALRVLRLNCLNLLFIQKTKVNPTHDPYIALRSQITVAASQLEPDARKNIAALAVLLGSLTSDALVGRNLARDLMAAQPQSRDAALLYVRSLLHGRFGTVLTTIDSNGKAVAAPRQSRMRLLPPEPKMDEALAELDRVEKRFGSHPSIDYYRAEGYAMKSYFFDPKKDDPKKLDAAAVYWVNRFLDHCAGYPRMEACARRYLSIMDFAAFYPWPDE